MNDPQIGDMVPQIEVTVSREDLIRYAGAADDYVRLHWDRDYATSSGFRDVAVHGWLTFAHMCRAVTEWLPPNDWTIASFAVRYRQPSYPGVLRCGGQVTDVGKDQVSLTIWARDAEGKDTTSATVTVRRLHHRDDTKGGTPKAARLPDDR